MLRRLVRLRLAAPAGTGNRKYVSQFTKLA
jgi:hypothetical protein